MIELILSSVLIGKVQISPSVVQLDYLTPNREIITVLSNVNSQKP